MLTLLFCSGEAPARVLFEQDYEVPADSTSIYAGRLCSAAMFLFKLKPDGTKRPCGPGRHAAGFDFDTVVDAENDVEDTDDAQIDDGNHDAEIDLTAERTE